MIAVIAPEPAPWVDLMLRRPEEILGDVGGGGAWLFAPWKLAGWKLTGRALRHTLRRNVAGMMEHRFAVRAAVDHLAARCLPRRIEAVVAPSCGSLRTFAVASRRGITTVLVEDLPFLRRLNADLDEAARRHPSCPLLARYRASARKVARQEREHVLADRLFVRGAFAAGEHAKRGRAVQLLPCSPPAPRRCVPVRAGREARLLLAGPPCGRSGINEAFAAATALGECMLLVRRSDAMEPANLLTRPSVRLASDVEVRDFDGVDLVVAPALCESYPEEIARAVALGVPVVATRRAAGAFELAGAGAEVQPYDVGGLRAAIARLITS